MARSDPNQMGFFEHLDELRGRMVWTLVIWVVIFIGCFMYHKLIFDFLANPFLGLQEGNSFVMVDPKEPFLASLRSAFWASLILSSWIIFYHIWSFVAPGLTRKEKWFALPFLIFMALFFILGCLFSFVQVFPTALDYLLSYHEGANTITRTYYLSILFAFVVGMGLSFEMPLVIFFLAKVGLVTPQFLLAKFKYAVLIIFTIAAVITPTPDPYIQTFLAVPMILLYLLGVLGAWMVAKKKPTEELVGPEPVPTDLDEDAS